MHIDQTFVIHRLGVVVVIVVALDSVERPDNPVLLGILLDLVLDRLVPPDKGHAKVGNHRERGHVHILASFKDLRVEISVRIMDEHVPGAELQTYGETEFHIDGTVPVFVHRQAVTGRSS